MAHGFGEKILGVGGKRAFDQTFDMTGKAIGTAYNSSKQAIGKASSAIYNSIAEEQARLANPTFTGRYGGKTNAAMFDNWFERNVVNHVAPRGTSARGKYNIGKHEVKQGWRNWKIGAGLSAGLYGLSAWAMDDDGMDASDRMLNVTKHGVAAGMDIASDAALTGVAAGLATFGGPLGIIAGGALTAFNIGAGLMGVDAGSLAMNFMNYSEEEYNKAKNGPKFNMTQNTAMTMQRQLSNIAMSGSNLGEMMHN